LRWSAASVAAFYLLQLVGAGFARGADMPVCRVSGRQECLPHVVMFQIKVCGITTPDDALLAAEAGASAIGLNFYEIDWRNLVTGGSFQGTVNACAAPDAPASCANTVIRDPATGQIVTVLANYFNQASTLTRGADLDAKYSLSTGFGRFTARLAATYIDTYKEDGNEVAGTNGGNISTLPRLKGYIALDWDNGPISLTAQMNYIHHYWQEFVASTFFVPNNPAFQTGVYPDQVPRYISYNLYGKYNVTKNLYVSGSIINVTAQKPPYDPGFSSVDLYDFSQYDPRGRQYRIGLTYKM